LRPHHPVRHEELTMIRNGKMKTENGTDPSAGGQFYSMIMLAILVILCRLIKMAYRRGTLDNA
jgi:hypothetical protein